MITMCSEIVLKYQICLISSKWMESLSEGKTLAFVHHVFFCEICEI